MMRGVNKVTLIGNLGKDPEIFYGESKIPMARITVATTESFRDKTGQVNSHTEWHQVVMWRGLAELAQTYLRKGSSVYIEGKLRTRSWEEKDGNTKSVTEIIAEQLILLDKRTDELKQP